MTGKRLELAIGVVLGVLLGIAVAYVLVTVVGSERDASEVSTQSRSSGGAEPRTRSGDRASP